MIINVGQSDNSASNPGHINYTFNDGNGNTFTVGVTSVGSLPPDHPAYRPSATMGGIGFEPLALDGVLHFETPMQGVTSAPIPLDAAQFASFLTFINANLGTNHSVANLAILPVDYDLGRAGLDPFTRPANLWTMDFLFGADIQSGGPASTWQQWGRDGLNCVELIFGWGAIPRVAPANFDFGLHIPMNDLNGVLVGRYAVQNYSLTYRFNIARVIVPGGLVQWGGTLEGVFKQAIDQRVAIGGTVDAAFIEQVYRAINDGIQARGLDDFLGNPFLNVAGVSTFVMDHIADADRAPLHLHNRCFAAGTLVTMGTGELRPIERILPGDVVAAFDEKEAMGRGRLHPARVLRVFKSESDDLVEGSRSEGGWKLRVA
jgi:hypothetical protein